MNSRMRLTSLFIVVLLAAGCAATPYGPVSESWMGGYSDSKLQRNTYNVSFTGNAWLSQEQARNYLYYRCAEITVREGFDYFVIISGESATSYSEMGRMSAVPKPNLTATIRLAKGRPPASNPDAFDARELMRNLEPQIHRP